MILSMKKAKVQLLSILIASGVGVLAWYLSRNSMEAFRGLAKPALTPPPSFFSVVWAVLYILMGISAALIYLSESPSKEHSLTLYAVQLAVNFLWPILFFNFNLYWFSFFWLLLLLGLIVSMMISFWKISPPSSLLQLPYLFWVLFAGYLNLMIAIHN